MYYAGCDLGSTSGKVAILKEDAGGLSVAGYALRPSGFQPDKIAHQALTEALALCSLDSIDELDALCATGYGRANVSFIENNISEISCHARGAFWLCPNVRTIIDVGGQDVKVITLNDAGAVVDFAMNDKCAAGTGRFFEAMARTLQCDVKELGELSLTAQSSVAISNQCSVFAESEVITYINQQVSRNDIAAGIHEAIAKRICAMGQRIGVKKEILLTGGCAKNQGLRKALSLMLGAELLLPSSDPQSIGAIGAALYARDLARREQ